MKRRLAYLAILLLTAAALWRFTAKDETSATLTVMTYNLHHCEGEDGVYDVKRIADFITDTGADIVLCQEVDREFSDRSNMERQPEMLADMLGFHHHYGPNIGETYGNLILSRFPIQRAKNIPLPNPDEKEPRGLIAAEITAYGTKITVLDTHLSAFSEKNRDEQVAFLAKYVQSLETPVILGADFNTKPSEQLRPLLDTGVLKATRDGVLGLGEGIDDILVSPDMAGMVGDGEIIENIYSDHPAYRINIKLP